MALSPQTEAAAIAPEPIQTTLYCIRHGIAAERGTLANDDDRPLVEKGRQRTAQVAQRLKTLGVTFDHVLTSPLVRAQQTAEILQAEGLTPAIAVCADLAPDGDLKAWLSWLATWQRQHPQGTVAIVGHEPDLSRWAQVLVAGLTAAGDRWELKKAGIIGLWVPRADRAIGQSELFWLTPPRLIL